MLRLSVLDQSPVPDGSSPGDALRNTIDLARLADEAGYHRYWLAEHHNTQALAGSSPEVLIGSVAAATERIRVGSGGVMLPHYSPLKVVESFRVLHALYPDRIDLGLGRAPGSDPLTARALQRDPMQPPADDFLQQLAMLMAYLDESFPADHPFAQIHPSPAAPGAPEVWLLGSSPDSASFAAQFALPYVFADFINPHGAGLTEDYRARFDRSAGREPRTLVAVAALCADTEEEAQRLAASFRAMRVMLRTRGRLGAVPTVQDAQAYLARAERGGVQDAGRAIVGDPAAVRAGIEDLASSYGAEEVILLTITHDHVARRRSYELIAKAFDLAPTSGAVLAARG